MQKLLKWLDSHLLPVYAGFLLSFIPLYPKLPLFDVLPGYIVRVRLEDFLVLSCIFIWFIYVLRQKIKLTDNPLLKPIIFYLIIGLLSIASGVFLINTIPQETIHIQKSLLHFFRRVEYFSLFFIFYSSLKNLRQVKIYLIILIATILLVSLYGFGQKYLYWPAFSTMNREFAKGWSLYLSEHARVLSTFGGHYDLAAFIMMSLIILWSLFFAVKKYILKIALIPILAAAFWTLILTASRTSFIAYIFGLILMFFFWSYKKGIFWSVSRFISVSLLSIILMLSFGDLSERFTKLLKLDARFGALKNLLNAPLGAPPRDKAFFLENNPDAIAQITSKSDMPPSRTRPSDVYQDFDLMVPKDGTVSAVKRTYSETAFKYDLSTAIRFDALWPQAIRGFKRNPLLGSGYATLNKIDVHNFTEAESTDNDFLRALGETGVLGFLAFFGTLLFILYYLWRHLTLVKDPVIFAAIAGFAGLLFGLLVNAVYIDVFESSKVAFSFWALAGISLGIVKILKKENQDKLEYPKIPGLQASLNSIKAKITNFVKSDAFFLLIIILLAFYLRIYKLSTPLADWHSWRQADTSAVSRNFIKHGINILYPTYDDLSNIASGKDNPRGLRFVEFPIFNVIHTLIDQFLVGYNVEIKGRLTSIIASLFSLIFIFLLVRKYSGRLTAFLAAIYFAIIPYNIFFSRVILPEPLLVALTTGMIYLFDQFLDAKYIKQIFYFVLVLLTASLALLSKPYAAFLFVPMVYLLFSKKGVTIKSLSFFFIFFLLVSLPFIYWRWWANHFPEGIPANLWLLNGDGIRFKGAFFFWIFADRIGRLILGFYGLPLLILGILAKSGKETFLYHVWGFSVLIYLISFATGNVRHDYYQILTLPIIAIYLAKGTNFIIEISQNLIAKIKSAIVVFILIIFMEMFGWYYIRDFYNINHPEIIEAGQAVSLKTPQNSLVIAPYGGDTAFLYQTERAGWPIMQKPIDEMIKMGAHFYVSVNFDDLTQELIKLATIEDQNLRKYKLIELNDSYTIIQLVENRNLPK